MFEDLIKERQEEKHTFVTELPGSPHKDKLLLFNGEESITSYWDGQNWIIFSNWGIKKEEN